MLKNLKLVLVTTTVLIGGVAGFAAAGGGHDKGAMKAKFAERKAEMLLKFDANKNGTLDPAEKQVMHDTRATKRFTALDTNKDGALSLAEFKAGKGRGGMHHGRRGHGKHRGMGGAGRP
ncbi:MAG: hypothetical protein H0T42_17300 [Deltaproteobacteria bacterium]|nr:hypothetical protein [Deltaproteobacteria bacterium]